MSKKIDLIRIERQILCGFEYKWLFTLILMYLVLFLFFYVPCLNAEKMYYVRFQTNQNKYMFEFCTQRLNLYSSYDNYQACRLEMVRHAQLATVTVSDGAKHCVTAPPPQILPGDPSLYLIYVYLK